MAAVATTTGRDRHSDDSDFDFGAYLDAAVALALVAFLATVAFARYIDRRDPRRPGQ